MPDASIYIGASTDEMQAALVAAERQAQKSGQRIGRSFEEAANSHESLFKNQRRVERSSIDLTRQVLSSGSAMDVAAASAEALEKALHLPVGVAIGLGAAAMGYEKLSEALKKVKEENEKAKEELANSPAATAAMGSDAASAQIKKNQEIAKEQEKSRTFAASAANLYLHGNGAYGTDEIGESLKLQNELNAQNFEIAKQLVGVIHEEVHAKQVLANESEKEGLLEQAMLKLHKEKARIELSDALPQQRAALNQAAQAEYELAVQEINFKAAAKDRELETERAILAVKEAGKDIAQESAREKFNAAIADETAARTEEEKKAAKIKKDAAWFAWEQETKATTEKKAQLKIETDIASSLASPDDKRLAKIMAQRAGINRRIERVNPESDEAGQLQLEQAKNGEALRAELLSIFQKGIQRDRANSSSKTGRGVDQQLAAANREIEILNRELKKSVEFYGEGSAEAAEINARLAAQQRHIEEINFTHIHELLTAKARTQEMELQERGELKGAHTAQIRAQFEEQIAKALHDQNTQLAEQLKKQEKIALEEQEIDEFLKTPKQKADERDEKRKRDQARRIIESRHKDHEHAQQANRSTFDERFHPNIPLIGGNSALDKGAMTPAEADAAGNGSTIGGNSMLDRKPGDPLTLGAMALDPAKAGIPDGSNQPATNPGATGAATDKMTIAQMTVEQMNVKVANFEEGNFKNFNGSILSR